MLDAASGEKSPTLGIRSSALKNGAPGTIRTADPKIRGLVLYPAELRRMAMPAPLRVTSASDSPINPTT